LEVIRYIQGTKKKCEKMKRTSVLCQGTERNNDLMMVMGGGGVDDTAGSGDETCL
jgi:hypothetical protein